MKYLATIISLMVLLSHSDALQCYVCKTALLDGEVNPEDSVPCDEASVTTCEDGKNACVTVSTSISVDMMGVVLGTDSINYACAEMSDENTVCSALGAAPTVTVKECSVDFCQSDLCNGDGETEDSGETDGGNDGGNGGGNGGGNDDEDNDGNEGGDGGQDDEESDGETDEEIDDQRETTGLTNLLMQLLLRF